MELYFHSPNMPSWHVQEQLSIHHIFLLLSHLPTLFYPWQVSPCSGHPTFSFPEDGDSKVLETAYVDTTMIYKQNSHMCVHNYKDEYTIQSPVLYMYGLLECHIT